MLPTRHYLSQATTLALALGATVPAAASAKFIGRPAHRSPDADDPDRARHRPRQRL